ncbi:hypothetical protein [Nannocystis bainbridge]|uniref:Uncharacterized protein n=1 Tax=Nannocystis bainbridge TaxID=2995303 RepID=A0ABT5E7B5_9BACT|nr:hypothetical protein [Nannocystis bainbridge]MDC0720661.1 hypothetical protein [Nannocystis bainbridge]
MPRTNAARRAAVKTLGKKRQSAARRAKSPAKRAKSSARSATRAARLTADRARAQLEAVGVTLEYDGNDYRVAVAGGSEDEGYQTDDLADALATGLEMAAEAARGSGRGGEAPAYYTVVIPYTKTGRTMWHPTEASGPFSVLTRGMFRTPGEATEWARKHLGRTDYEVRPVMDV